MRVSIIVLLIYGGLLGLTYWVFMRTPTGFIPAQDKGYLLVNVQLPDSASLERTQQVMKSVEQLASKLAGVSHTMAIAGQSILMNANAPNFGAMYVMLDEFHHRAQHGLTGPIIAAQLQNKLQDEIRDGLVNVFDAPPVDGLGTAGGFKVVVQDRGDLGSNEIEAVADRIVDESRLPRNRGCSPVSSRAFAPTRPGFTSTSTAIRPSWRAFRSPSFSTLFRSTWARSTSTTSTASAVPGRSTCRATPISASS